MIGMLSLIPTNKEVHAVKCSRSDVRRKAHALPEIKFEDQTLTSFAGLVLLQKFFATLQLKTRLAACFRAFRQGKVFDRAGLFLQLIVHRLLGFRELQDVRYYQDDPLVKRLLGLKRLPDVSTLSRMLKEATADSPAVLHHGSDRSSVRRVAPARQRA